MAAEKWKAVWKGFQTSVQEYLKNYFITQVFFAALGTLFALPKSALTAIALTQQCVLVLKQALSILKIYTI